ncbi:MAG: Rrf2 family transcriptional regulator [Gemmataceae bacterium]|nr:Rrf2 family transcriptional regulator [Gemmataceae bacterium]
MRLSAKAQYACVALLELATSPEEQPVQVKSLADAHGISSYYLVQILLSLKMRGLVRSTRGAAGGYQLARRPESISLADIVQALDETAPARPALSKLKSSPAVQALGSVLQELDARQDEMLRAITLADLQRRAEQSNLPTYQI